MSDPVLKRINNCNNPLHCVHLTEHFAHAERLSKLSRVSTPTEKLMVFMKNTIFTFKKLIFMDRKRL